MTLLNIHKPRDRSHYERFESYHEIFYRSVEATSVTPFSPLALNLSWLPAVENRGEGIFLRFRAEAITA